MPTAGDCYDATLSTAGGLVFVGSREHHQPDLQRLRRQDRSELWNFPTGIKVAISAPGITYEANGKQYVAVLQGGGGGNSNQQRNTGHGDISMVCFRRAALLRAAARTRRSRRGCGPRARAHGERRPTATVTRVTVKMYEYRFALSVPKVRSGQ